MLPLVFVNFLLAANLSYSFWNINRLLGVSFFLLVPMLIPWTILFVSVLIHDGESLFTLYLIALILPVNTVVVKVITGITGLWGIHTSSSLVRTEITTLWIFGLV